MALDDLRMLLGDGPSDAVLQALLAQTGGDVSAAANRFFDGGPSASAPPRQGAPSGSCFGVSDDVMATLLKTLDDVGRTLSQRDLQLDTTTRVCEVLHRRLTELEAALAAADANESERAEGDSERAEEAAEAAEAVSAAAAAAAAGASPLVNRRLAPALLMLAGLPLHLLRLTLPRVLLSPLGRLPLMHWLRRVVGVGVGVGGGGRVSLKRTRDDPEFFDAEAVARAVGEVAEEGYGEEDEEAYEDEEEGEEDDEHDGEEDDDVVAGDEVAEQPTASEDSAARVAAIAASLADAQAAAQAALDLPSELLRSASCWEEQQSAAEAEWRQRQARLSAELEERKRRLQERQTQQRKKLRDDSDGALRPLYHEGAALCAQIEAVIKGKLCRLSEVPPSLLAAGGASSAVQAQARGGRAAGPLARITGVTFGRIDSPIRALHVPTRGANGVSVSSGLVVTLEKILDRNGVAMLPASEDPMPAFRSRSSVEVKLPLRMLGSLLAFLSDEETAALPAACGEAFVGGETFVVRYAGGERGAPIEPVQILPEGLSLADYHISFAAGITAMRVEHRTDGPVKCRAEPVARKQVFAETPLELYTQEIDEATHNIVQLYFSDLRNEVAIDVLNTTGTGLGLDDAECSAFPEDATGAQLNYKIICRDARVAAVLYQEGGHVRPSPFVEHRLPPAGAYVALSDGALGVLGPLPRGLVVARESRDLPENAPCWPPRPGLRAKGKHPAELSGMVDVKVVQRDGRVAWPPEECSAPVCAMEAAGAARLAQWHAQWDGWLRDKGAAAEARLEAIEAHLADAAARAGGGAPSAAGVPVVPSISGLTELYSELEAAAHELAEAGGATVDPERLTAVQRGIQRFAALARFG